MIRRPDLVPALTAEGVSVDHVLEHLRQWHADTLATIESLRVCREQVEANAKQLESPRAALEYVDFFIDLFGRAAADLERVETEAPRHATQAHVDLLRQIASNAAAEQRRCGMFRDKWINRPLPYEQVRPLLTRISTDTRDQLADYRDLNRAAALLEGVVAHEPESTDTGRALDRRALLTRLIGRDVHDREEGS